jgi:AraC-like DNA-binding protein
MESPAGPPTQFQFSTNALARRERLAAWREIFGRTVVDLDIQPLNRDEFFSEATVCRLPGLGVLFGCSAAMRLDHTKELIRDDDLSFMAAPTCRWAVSQFDRNPVLGPGDGVLMTNGHVGSMTLASASRFVTFRVPASALSPLVPDMESAVARPIPADNVALRLLVRYLASSLDTQALATPQMQKLAITHIYDLLALTLGATRDATEIAKSRGVRAARLRVIKADIMQRLSQHNLSIAGIAKRHGISPVYVRKLFERDGTSFSEFVLGRRLARAHRMLSDAVFSDRTIATVALEAGFGDLSYFNRAFRRRYGASPSDVRAAAWEAGEVVSGTSAADSSDQRLA